MERTFTNGDGIYWYDISGFQSLEIYSNVKELEYTFVERLILSICEVYEELEWGLISSNLLKLEPEYIYLAGNGEEFRFIAIPNVCKDQSSDTREYGVEKIKLLVEFLLTKINHSNQATVGEVYSLYSTIVQGNGTISDLKAYINSKRTIRFQKEIEHDIEKKAQEDYLKRESEERSIPVDCVHQNGREFPNVAGEGEGKEHKFIEFILQHSDLACMVAEKYQSLRVDKTEHNKKIGHNERDKIRKKRGKAELYDDYVVQPSEHDESDEHIPETYQTICIPLVEKTEGLLKYEGEEALTDIRLQKDEIKIGHGAGVDVQIWQKTVSHLHARVIREGEDYYLEDLNSTNGTFLNGELLPYHTKYKLSKNDIIKFADVQYRFF